MNCYRVHYKRIDGESAGFEFVPTLEAARSAGGIDPEGVSWERITVEMTKAGVIKALNQYASHPDNG